MGLYDTDYQALRQKEIEEQLKWKDKLEQLDWYSLSKSVRTTYKIRDNVDVDNIKSLYPDTIKETIDAKKLYDIALDAEEFVEKSETVSISLRTKNEQKA